jgi:formiminoglutamate deiminase
VNAYWCELAWLGGEGVEGDVLVEIEEGRFSRVEAGVARSEGAERLAGLTLPGFANAHSHAFHRALRGRTEAGRGSFWSWREEMYALAERLDPDTYHALARAAFAEMLLAGYTTVGEFHYLHHGPDGTPYEDPNEVGRALLAAAAQAGIRITLLDACYLHGKPGEPLAGVQRRFGDRDAERWAVRIEALGDPGPGASVGAAIHSIRAVDPAAAGAVAAWAAVREAPLHAHVSEQAAENEAVQVAYGRRPLGVLEEAGALSERFTAVHFTHVDEGELALLGARGCGCCLCPTTERDLADGIGRAGEIAAAGAGLCLGSDSHAVIDPFEEMRAVELDERLATGERGHHTATELLRMATRDGNAALDCHEAGTIEPGAIADLVTIGFDGVRLADATAQTALESVVFAASPADIRRVIAGGRELVRDGAHADLDVAAELRSSIRAVTEGAPA